jgi:two-component system, OmpR family, sensor histidine kinase VicK
MHWINRVRIQPWGIISGAVGGLLVAVAIAGLMGLFINNTLLNVTERALVEGVQLEDLGDDLRVAILDLRHYHRNLIFAGLSPRALAEFDAAYIVLLEQVARLDETEGVDSRVVEAGQMRQMAAAYYTDFRAALDLFEGESAAFHQASDRGLAALGEMEQVARQIERLGERSAEEAFEAMEQATATARLMLLVVLGGLVLVGMGLAYLVVTMVREQHRASEKLARALQAKTDFIADASHELRTPLTVLRGNAELALEIDRTCVHVEALEEILQESERMSRLVDDLLLLARSDSGAMPLELAAVDVATFLRELEARAAVLARERGAEFEAALRGQGQLVVDAGRLEQVALILVDNAAKYGPAGGLVKLIASTGGDELCIEVADQGPGIQEEDLARIFERFYRVDKTRARHLGGAGLGLSIAKTIIESHGGRIEARSQLNRGTQMRIYIPLASTMPAGGAPVEQQLALEHAG